MHSEYYAPTGLVFHSTEYIYKYCRGSATKELLQSSEIFVDKQLQTEFKAAEQRNIFNSISPFSISLAIIVSI